MKSVHDGLAILLKYVDAKGWLSAEHDEIFADGPPPGDMTTDDSHALEVLGWDYDEDLPAWHKWT